MVTIFYHTAWSTPVIHCSVMNSPWHDTPLVRTSRHFWYTVEVDSYPVSFVFTDGHGHWDNPSSACVSSRSHNYYVSAPGRYAVFRGDIVPISPASRRVLLITDLDGTLVLQGDSEGDAASARFVRTWLQHHYFNDSVLVYCSGRCLDEYLQLRRSLHELLDPDLYIGEVGGDAFAVNRDTGEYEVRQDYRDAFPPTHWDTAFVSQVIDAHFPWLIVPPAHGNCRLSTYRIARVEDISEHEAALRAFLSDPLSWSGRAIHCLLHVSGSGSHRYLDFTAEHGGKKAGLLFSRQVFGFGPEETLVAGDSGNDLGMFEGPERGVIPANRQEEMDRWMRDQDRPGKYVSQLKYADAVVEALSRL